MEKFEEMLLKRQLFKEIVLFFDIETLQFNEEAGKTHPSDYKNVTYSVAISWMSGEKVSEEVFPDFKKPLDIIMNTFSKQKKKPIINLIAHNTNKYDNHFMRKDLLYYYPFMKVENFWLSTSNEKGNEESLKIKDLTTEQKKGVILEKRIKSSINLEITFYLNGQKFYTTDNWVKTNSSLKSLGEKLNKMGVLSEDEMKTDFDYIQYNKKEDMTDEEARAYARQVFDNLDEEEMTYIKNDVIILAKVVYYYSELFKDFDYSKTTFTSNVLESYNTNDLTSFQLLNRVGEGKEKQEIRYTDYQFANQNFYDYLKHFYRGGLNFYNQFFVGKIIRSGVFGIDINSSYPYAMHYFKIPTYLHSYEEHETEQEVTIEYTDDYYSLFQISKETFDNLILNPIQSIIVKQILVKYYNTNEFININSYTFKMIEQITGVRYESIPAFNKITFETKYFGSREKIEEFYQVKTQGKNKNKLLFHSPYDIKELNEENEVLFSEEEIAISKVNLNGLYGIPALRPFFNLFRLHDNKYINIENGHRNNERNIVFSIFVTSVSLWNLLSPFKYLTQKEIDENFLYSDTDSLYFKQEVKHKMPDELFHDMHLGKWDMEHDNMPYFYVLNHKKYVFYDYNKKEKKYMIHVRAGGVPLDSFDIDMSFEEFIETQFSDGVEIKNNKSIYNSDETISIYPSTTKLEVGKGYRIHSNNKLFDGMKERMLNQIKEHVNEFNSDVMYVESELGSFSISDVFPFTFDVKQKEPLVFLEIKQDKIRKKIEAE